jgi:hypothetical protein
VTHADVVVSRRAVREEPLLEGARHDYADTFVARLAEPDTRTAEEWARAGLEAAPGPVRRLILIAHRRVLRFRPATGSPAGTVLGWAVVVSEPDVVLLEASGPLMRGVIVGRRTEPTVAELSTFLCYSKPWVRVVWAVVAPVHRRVARYLMERAARAAHLP